MASTSRDGSSTGTLWQSTTYRASRKRFGILIDAGSSGSRAFVYHWPVRRFRSTLPDLTTPILQHAGSYKSTPGLSSCMRQQCKSEK
jgi:Golgi nucleoside diphosphatase